MEHFTWANISKLFFVIFILIGCYGMVIGNANVMNNSVVGVILMAVLGFLSYADTYK